MSPHWSNRRHGMTLIFVVLLMLVFIGFVGLALDMGLAALANHQLQNAADAAALAGARVVRTDPNDARTQAVQFAERNPVASVPLHLARNDDNAPTGEIVLGRYERKHGTFRATTDVPNAVQVNGRRPGEASDGPVPLLFGPLFGMDSIALERTATAMNQGGTGAGLVVLCPDCECALMIGGNSGLTVATTPEYGGAAAIQVNSADSCAVCGEGGSIVVTADEMNIVGEHPGDCWTGSPTLNCDINPGSPPIPDPLANLPAPTWNPSADLGTIDSTGTYSPGYYSGGVRLTSTKATATLNPGIYVVDGQGGPQRGLFVNGGNLIAHEVMFYVIGAGVVYLGGNGTIDISPSMNEEDTYWGVTIFQARDNWNEVTIIGTGAMNLQGTYYFPHANVRIQGESLSLGNMMISWSYYISGHGTFNLAYDGRFNQPGDKIFLVR